MRVRLQRMPRDREPLLNLAFRWAFLLFLLAGLSVLGWLAYQLSMMKMCP